VGTIKLQSEDYCADYLGAGNFVYQSKRIDRRLAVALLAKGRRSPLSCVQVIHHHELYIGLQDSSNTTAVAAYSLTLMIYYLPLYDAAYEPSQEDAVTSLRSLFIRFQLRFVNIT
jgi:hypothetical protein